MEWISQVNSWLNGAISGVAGSPWVYPASFIFIMIDGFFPPVPSESVVVGLASTSRTTGTPNLFLLGVVAATAAWVGDNIAYQIGRLVVRGAGRTSRVGKFLKTPKIAQAMEWAEQMLERRGALMILVARNIPVGRVAVNFTAGGTGFPRVRFMLLTGVAAVLWAGMGIGMGVIAGTAFKDQPFLAVAVAIPLALVLGLIVDRIIQRFLPPPADHEHPLTDPQPKAGAEPDNPSADPPIVPADEGR